MNKIKGYITVPFHGEKGDSAYDIAVKYGYTGTEEEWVDSLGFIPDKSIGEEKLTDEMAGKLAEYKLFIDSVFEEKEEYSPQNVNDYSSLGEYVVPYRLIGIGGTYKIKIPKIAANVNVFNEADENLWSTEMGDYRLSKIDVSGIRGKNVRIYGVANTVPTYPCAFCVDSDSNILSRYGTDTNTVYGYKLLPGYISGYTFTNAIEAVIPENAKYLYISGRKFTSSGVVTCDASTMLEVKAVTGFVPRKSYTLMQSPLYGKKLYTDGDSICYGNGYEGGYGKIIADKYSMELINNGVGSATVTSFGATNKVSYSDTMDWENNTYYLKITGFEPLENKSIDGFAYPITKDIYENGFGLYPTTYKVVNGELIEQEYSETMPSGTFFVKFDVPINEGYSVSKYYRMWSANNWLWEAYRYGFKAVHESGKAEIATARHWLSKSVENVDKTADYIILEGGINDYLMNRRLGKIAADMTGDVDTTTVIGAMEHICRTLLKKCIGKKLLYIITPKAKNYSNLPNSSAAGGKTLTDYHDAILSVLKKYSIPVVDLFETSMMNTEIEEYLAYTKANDGVHPTREGYELFYVPQIVSALEGI